MPRTRITKRVADAAVAKRQDWFIWDADIAGFGLRVSETGRKAFVAQYRVGGGRGSRQRRVTIGPFGLLTVDQARTRAREILARARLGGDPAKDLSAQRGADMTVRQLCELWKREAASIDRRTGKQRRRTNVDGEIARLECHVLPLIGDRRVNELSRIDVERLRDAIASGATARSQKTKPRGVRRVTGGHGTSARTVRLLASIFAFALERGLLASNPARGVRLQPTRKLERYLTAEELRRLGQSLRQAKCDGANGMAIAIIQLLALTGARRGEIEGLRWSEVDFERGFLRLVDSKTGPKSIALSPAALAVLDAQPRQAGTSFVFPALRSEGCYQGASKVWLQVRIRADLGGVRLHDLRHTFASIGVNGGLGLPVIGALLGHRQAATTARYAHLADDPVRRAAILIGEEIAAKLATD